MEERLFYPPDLLPPVSTEDCNKLLLWAVETRASDIVFLADNPVWVQVDGIWHRVTKVELSRSEVDGLVEGFSGGAQQLGSVQGGKSVDFAYPIRRDNGEFVRFRVNVTNTSLGPDITMRTLPTDLPVLADMHLESTLVDALYPQNGLIIVSGVMGSGKSTLLAAVLRDAIRTRGRQVLTLEEPIEFDFTSIPRDQMTAPVAQTGIGQHISSWQSGVRTMTRRKGEVVLVGEARDRETIESMLGTVETGVTAYCTVHAMDVPQTITRIVNVFGEEEKGGISATLKASLRLIIHQRLVPRIRSEADIVNGVSGRIALREYLVFTEAVRRELYKVSFDQLIPTIREYVDTKGLSLVADARMKHAEGLISDETIEYIEHEQLCQI